MKDKPAFPNASIGGMTQRQWYKGMIVSSLTDSQLLGLGKNTTEPGKSIADYVGALASALIREDEQHESPFDPLDK